jgi:cysteine-rich repeat protein
MRLPSVRAAVIPLVFSTMVVGLVVATSRSVRVQSASCGNGTIELGETCDDGNQISGDGCSATCQVEEQCYDAGNQFSFFLWSDSYTAAGSDGVLRVLADAVNRARYPDRLIPRFWISTGDIPYMSVSDTALDDLNDSISNSPDGANYPFACSASSGKFPYFVAVGNHDVGGYDTLTPQQQYAYWRNQVGPKLPVTLTGISNFRLGPTNGDDASTTYSFDYKNAHFVVVNQYHDDPTYPTDDPVACIRPSIYQWVDQDLSQTTQPIKFVFGHEPAWSYCSNLAGYGGDFCDQTNVDNQTPPARTRPYSQTGDWLEPFGEHWGDSLEDSRCPDGSREAFWSMIASHNVIAHFVGHTHTYSGRLVQSDGTRRNDVSAYSKTGQTYSTADGVWEVNTGQTHNSGGTLYVLVTIKDNVVTFEGYDQITYAINEPFQLVESWSVSLDGSSNHPPQFSAIPPQTIGAGSTLTFTASATDPDAGQSVTYSLTGAPAGASIDPVSGVFTWTPTTAQVGSFNFWVKATDNGMPPAASSTPVTVTVTTPPPDLVETSVSTGTTAIAPGGTFQVTDTVANQGSKAGSFTIGFHLSTDSAYGGSDDVAMTAKRTVKSLSASTSSTGSTVVTVPAGTPVGSYHVCATADQAGIITEVSETNNSLCTASTVNVGRPDLVLTQLQPGATSIKAKGTATLPVTDTVQNAGPLASASFKIEYRLSINAVFGDADDVILNVTRSVGALAPGATSQATTMLGIPDRTAPGAYYVCAKADPGNTIVELNESNNSRCSAAPITVTP